MNDATLSRKIVRNIGNDSKPTRYSRESPFTRRWSYAGKFERKQQGKTGIQMKRNRKYNSKSSGEKSSMVYRKWWRLGKLETGIMFLMFSVNLVQLLPKHYVFKIPGIPHSKSTKIWNDWEGDFKSSKVTVEKGPMLVWRGGVFMDMAMVWDLWRYLVEVIYLCCWNYLKTSMIVIGGLRGRRTRTQKRVVYSSMTSIMAQWYIMSGRTILLSRDSFHCKTLSAFQCMGAYLTP